jgi:hypothetical protein
MSKKNFLFGSLAFLGITLLILSGCPNVVDNGTAPPAPSQDDVTVTVPVAKGDTTLGIELTDGSFKSTLTTDLFTIDSNGTGFALGTDPKIKVAPGSKIFTVTGSQEVTKEDGGTVKVTIKSGAFAPSTVVTPDKATGQPVGIQGEIAAKAAAVDVDGDHNAIEVTLTKGVFNPGITMADFIPANDSKIKVEDYSTVTLSSDNKKATIFGAVNGSATGSKAKVGIKQSALFGYPLVTETDVTITSVKGTDPYINVESSVPIVNDNYITVSLDGSDKFNAPNANDFVIPKSNTNNTNGISIGTGTVAVNSAKTKAVIKVETGSTTASAFWLKINKNAFVAVPASTITVGTTKQDLTLSTTDEVTGDGIKTVLDITLSNGGKFKNPLTTNTGFVVTVNNSDLESSVFSVVRNSDSNVIITLSSVPANAEAVVVTITAASVLDDSWPVDDDDIELSWNAS